MYQARMKAYEGDGNYIFVSYAHKDSDFVLPIIDDLHDLGYQIWFDEGIEASAEWPEFIEDHLSRCTSVMAFVTDNFVKSQNCRKEVTYALNQNKPLICVMPDKIDLGKGLALQLSDQQQFTLSAMNPEKFYQKLAESGAVESCRWKEADGTIVKGHKKLISRKIKAKSKSVGKILLIAVVSILLLFGAVLVHAFLFPEVWEEDTSTVYETEKDTSLWPTEMFHVWDEDPSGEDYCVGCGAQTGDLEGEPKPLVGEWSDETITVGFSQGPYWVPLNTIRNCTKMTMTVSLSDIEGDPFCEWSLWARDEKGDWKRIVSFDVTKEMENQSVDIPLEFDTPITFTGLFVACNDEEAIYTLNFDTYYKGVVIEGR